MRKTLPLLAASAMIAALGATAAQAQETAPAQAPQEQAAPQGSAEITDEMINSFTLAMNQVTSLNEKFSAQIQAAPDDAARTELQRQAATEMGRAVQQAGITPQQYNMIAQAAQNDEALRLRIGQAMQANGVAAGAN
ncbi:DUF4168 domain-containing protein [Phenylobacterium sp.]|uniref:DUF4168 domain-containing protein n=1 Tax=Phenylobacterium sp. TaxID=1871053 RepID=UPI0025DDF0DB|nr:DUF4168 domain-containing protein [Phenylobacterium sp.]